MAAETSWHRYVTKLRHCQFMYLATRGTQKRPFSTHVARIMVCVGQRRTWIGSIHGLGEIWLGWVELLDSGSGLGWLQCYCDGLGPTAA